MKMKQKQLKSKNPLKYQNISPDKFYPYKRQPLAELSFYPKSIMIDDHFLDNLHKNNYQIKSKLLKKDKIIKFIGDKNQNIKIIIQNFDSLTQSQNQILMKQQKQIIQQEFSEILIIFYQKIYKIRKQRDFYKNSLETEKTSFLQKINQLNLQINSLRNEICCLQKQKQATNTKLQVESKKKIYYQRQNSIMKQKLKVASLNSTLNPDHVNSSFQFVEKYQKESILISDNESRTKLNFYKQDEPQKPKNSYLILDEQSIVQNQNNKISYQQKQQLQVLLKKHNLQPDQLCKIIQQYLLELKQYHDIQFENQQQKRLFFLAKRMQDKIWNKKIKKDIQRLMNIKESIQTNRKPLKGKKY